MTDHFKAENTIAYIALVKSLNLSYRELGYHLDVHEATIRNRVSCRTTVSQEALDALKWFAAGRAKS